MSLQDDVKILLEFVNRETARFVTRHNGGKMPTADELMEHADSFEFPDLSLEQRAAFVKGEVKSHDTQSFFVWRKQHVLRFITTWGGESTQIKADELPQEKWPAPLQVALAKSIELQTPDGTKHKIL